MNKVKQVYQVVYNNTGYVVSEKETRDAARAVFKMVGGAADGYSLKQITTVVVEQKIR
ncbi:hypothetical protein D3C87_323460 [compost metagenome]